MRWEFDFNPKYNVRMGEGEENTIQNEENKYINK